MDGKIASPLPMMIHQSLRPMLRCEAECDPAFKQVIPYAIIEHKPSGMIFMTTRLGGDERLIGQASIGLGGHMENGESIFDCLYRELNEEVGLQPEAITDTTFCGFLYSEASEVDSVHVGMVYHICTDRFDLVCLEKDKLTGAWYTPADLRYIRAGDHMESWSAIVTDELFGKEEN